jgi:ubiquinone/menaquinone biosynthesis C-methylase UbiE
MRESLTRAYNDKTIDYFQGVRHDVVDDLPSGRALTILEIGCGAGATLALAKSQGKASHTVGVEIDSSVAALARTRVDQLIEGNVETMELPFAPCSFDAVILSEVLEHLVDPWRALQRLQPLLKVGGLIYASSPNVAHITTLRTLLRNRWDYSERGRFDWTHLRWFTPATYREMIEGAGFEIIWVRPISAMTVQQRIVNAFTLNRLSHLFVSQIFIKAQRII